MFRAKTLSATKKTLSQTGTDARLRCVKGGTRRSHRNDNPWLAIAFLGLIIVPALTMLLSPSTSQRHIVAASHLALASVKKTMHMQVSTTALKSATSPTSTPQVIAKAPDTVSTAQAKLTAHGMNAQFAALYLEYGKRYNVPWQVLASIHFQETRQRGNTIDPSTAGAIGPMQFEPRTFVGGWKTPATPVPVNSSYCASDQVIKSLDGYGVDANGVGYACMTDVNDAIASAAHYLAADTASYGSLWAAIQAYNGTGPAARTYVDQVWARAKALGL